MIIATTTGQEPTPRRVLDGATLMGISLAGAGCRSATAGSS